MNQDEQRIITQFVERIAGAAPAPAAGGSPSNGPWGGASVPATQTRPNLPPVDREADAMLADLFTKNPEARYRITQTAFVQEAALVEAQNRIRRLEWEVENAQRQAQQAQGQRGGGGLFGGMFGGGQQQRQGPPMPPPPQPQYPPNYNPGMLQQGRGGSGFLGTALTTAAGVAGGMVVGNMLMNAFSGHHGGAEAATLAGNDATGSGAFGQDAVPASSPWTDPGSAAGSQGWGEDGGAKSDWAGGGGEPDKFGGGAPSGDRGTQDASPAGYDDGGAVDDGGSYEDDV
jgi:hypothetical protein